MRASPTSVLAVAVAVAVAGCAEAPVRAPELHGITPAQATSEEARVVVIDGAHLVPLVVTDFSRPARSRLAGTFTASLVPHGLDASQAVALSDVSLTSSTALSATVPVGLPRGEYDVVVVDPAGRAMTLEAAYRVVASAETVAGFRIEAIGTQRARSPFVVVLAAVDALGRVVDGFSGAATLSDTTGTLTPTDTGPFALGRARVLVAVAVASPANVLTVRDILGHVSTSEAFEVKPGLAVALAVRSAAQTLPVGACSQPVDVGLEDVFGQPTQAEVPLSVELGAGPLDEVRFFSDAACAVPMASVSVQAGEAGASAFFASTRAGSPTLRVWSASLTSASQRQEVRPGAPSSLGFSTPGRSVRAGDCSAAVTVESLDAYGNASPVAAGVALLLEATPSAGVEFYADAACTTALTSPLIAAGSSSSTLYFKAPSPGPLHLAVTASLGTTTQEEAIAP